MAVPLRRTRPTVRLLEALIDCAPGWMHGYGLSKATGLKSGTLYPLLLRLGEAGWLESRWEQATVPGRPPRHLYRLSPGAAAAAQDFVRANAAGERRHGFA